MKKKFFVSCQALKDEPLFGEGIMNKMAHAAIIGGADGIRTSQIHNVKSMIDDPKINLPIIGIIKKDYPNSEVFITATIDDLSKLIETGVEIIAIDATLRKRPKDTLEEQVNFFNQNKKSNQKLMADCSSLEDIENAIRLEFDLIGTTLAGYTSETRGKYTPNNDFFLIREAKKLTTIPIVAEGGVDTPELAQMAFRAGADIVVVGSQITRPRLITKRFVDAINKERRHDDKS